ncbi:ribonuclease III family protein [Clostridium fessum]|uniref:ribonuclease III family protein n=1 Tax=Clostridium fessum TaxID=2126740 RepID=UPI002A82A7C3|nr:ribonuclease III domain-containing protein [Clostridium fessum]MDY4928000.1 ribonuclease III domain-containing protein [Clostridium fessum]
MSRNEQQGATKKKSWPKNCPWPEPTDCGLGYDEDFTPDKGENLSEHVNLLRIALMDPHNDPVIALRSAFSYNFINENLLRQAFTRRSFQIEHGLSGCSEELEFLGDSILTTIVTKEIFKQFSETNCEHYEAPFESKFKEGELTTIRQQFTSREALAARARELGLGRFILYGTGEQETDSSLEDMMEALIGAVVIDCNWEMETVEKMVNELLCIQLDSTDTILKKSYYDILGAWHQKHFGCIPTYKISASANLDRPCYWCKVCFNVPKNDKGEHTIQQLSCDGETRSKARENAARKAYDFIVEKGLWKNLSEAGIVPDPENSINQLQELYQKKYLDNPPEYEYEDSGNEWYVTCRTEGYCGDGAATTKVKAKKKAAYMVIVDMLISAGICKDEWHDTMVQNMTSRE